MARNFLLTADTATAQTLQSLRDNAYERATKEARRYPAGRDPNYRDVCARLEELIAEGRRELASRQVAAGDVEAWDRSFRVMFLLRSWQPA